MVSKLTKLMLKIYIESKKTNYIHILIFPFYLSLQGSADSNYSQPSSDLSLDEERENLRRETERQAISQLEKARVSDWLRDGTVL